MQFCHFIVGDSCSKYQYISVKCLFPNCLALKESRTPVLLTCSYCFTIFFSFCQGSLETFSLDVLVSLLRQENAVDLCVIKVPEQIKYAEYFIVVSGVSPRHLRAMALYAIKVVTYLCLFFVTC